MSALVHRTLTDRVASQLRDLIISGDLPPGTALRLRELATRLGVSVMPVREAIRVLETERLVVNSPHRGATVLQLSAEEIEEIYAMRAALERLAARRAMERIQPQDVLALSRQFETMSEAAKSDDLDRFTLEDREFHRMLYEVSGRKTLQRKILELAQTGTRAVKLGYGPWRPLALGIDAHRPIMQAIEVGDPDLVSQLIYEHVTEGGARIYGAVVRWEADRRLNLTPGPDSATSSAADVRRQAVAAVD